MVLLLLIVLIPFFCVFERFLYGNTSVFMILGVALSGCIIRLWSLKKVVFKLPDFLLILYLLWGIVNLLFVRKLSVDPLLIYEWIGLVGVYLLVRSGKGEYILLYAIVLAGMLQALIGVFQQLGILDTNHPDFAVTGSFFNPGPYAGFLMVAFVTLIGILWQSVLRWRQVCLTVVLILIGYALVLADARAAWLGAGGGCLYFFWQAGGCLRRKRWLALIPVVLAFSCLLLYYYRPASADGRLLVWKIAGRMFADAPWTGQGIGSLGNNYMYYQAGYFSEGIDTTEAMLADNNFLAFNEWLHLAGEQGIVGLVLMGTLLFVLLWSWTVLGDDRITCVARSALLAFVIFASFSYPAQVLPLKLLFVVCGAVVANRFEMVCSFPCSKVLKVGAAICILGVVCAGGREYFMRKSADRILSESLTSSSEDRLQFLKDYYPRLVNSPDFVLCYGKQLYDKGRYQEALVVLEQASRLRPSSAVLCDLGDCYFRARRLERAESCLQTAVYMVPGLIMPRYALFEFYRKSDDRPAAATVAADILHRKVKVVNSVTLDIRSEVKKYLMSVDMKPNE